MASLTKMAQVALSKERVRRLKAQNQKAALELREKLGDLVPLDLVVRDFGVVILAAKTRFLALPAKVAPRLLGLEKIQDIEVVLRQEVEDILSDLAYGPPPVDPERLKRYPDRLEAEIRR